MPVSMINGVRLYWEETGSAGPALVLVHGSWGDHHNWDGVVPVLARSFRVFTYDRRGHSQSERPAGQGSIEEDVADLAAFVRANDVAPAHIVGNSFGAATALKLAAQDPGLFASMIVHEPPLLGMLQNTPILAAVHERIGAVLESLRSGRMEAAAQQFVDTVALGPGMWEKLPEDMRRTFVYNGPTFLDEQNEPEDVMSVSLSRLAAFDRPALFTDGDQSPPFFSQVLEKILQALPNAERHTFDGAGHVPHVTHPAEYVSVVTRFVQRAAGAGLRA